MAQLSPSLSLQSLLKRESTQKWKCMTNWSSAQILCRLLSFSQKVFIFLLTSIPPQNITSSTCIITSRDLYFYFRGPAFSPLEPALLHPDLHYLFQDPHYCLWPYIWSSFSPVEHRNKFWIVHNLFWKLDGYWIFCWFLLFWLSYKYFVIFIIFSYVTTYNYRNNSGFFFFLSTFFISVFFINFSVWCFLNDSLYLSSTSPISLFCLLADLEKMLYIQLTKSLNYIKC